jgi:hydroxyethylthiazole kinase-like uncharacterized protein yjeF
MVVGYSAQQIRDAEAPHLAAGEPLMQRAAAALADEIVTLLRTNATARILVLVGSGNNGGDALYAAAVLAERGCDVVIVSVGSRIHEAGLAAALAAGAHGDDDLDTAAIVALARSSAVVVDAILGTGSGTGPSASHALRGRARDVASAILPIVTADDGPIVVAVDIPSGIDPDSGSVPDPLVLPARVTVTFGGYKAGLLRQPAATLAGDIRLIDIGLGDELAAMEPLVRSNLTAPEQG